MCFLSSSIDNRAGTPALWYKLSHHLRCWHPILLCWLKPRCSTLKAVPCYYAWKRSRKWYKCLACCHLPWRSGCSSLLIYAVPSPDMTKAALWLIQMVKDLLPLPHLHSSLSLCTLSLYIYMHSYVHNLKIYALTALTMSDTVLPMLKQS